MRVKLGLLLLGSAVAGCNHVPQDLPDRGYAAVKVPVVTRADYMFEAAAPDGMLAPAEAARLDGWFRSLNLGYGDSIYVDGAAAYGARDDIARIAGQYGLMLSPGAPVTAGAVAPGMVRVIVSRVQASVPGCPDWRRVAQPNYNNRTMPNFGCAVNSNLAAMVANPQDLVHGREGTGLGDPMTASKAVGAYRNAVPTGNEGLQDISTKKDEK